METITLTIDGQEVRARGGMTVLEVAQKAGIYIPTLCYHPNLEPYGACRLCIVEIEKMRGLPTSCTTPAADGMVVQTDTPLLTKLRRNIFELILTEHPHSCLICPENGRCQLQEVARYIGLEEVRFPYAYKGLPIERGDPFFDRDYNLCILCGQCVRVCQEVRSVGAVSFTYRGSQALIGTAFGQSLEESGCEFCGACVDACPTGALMERANRWEGSPDQEVATICPYCGVGCQLKLGIKKGRIIRVTPDPEGPANHGQACAKGRFGISFVHDQHRLTSPLIKRDGEFTQATWDEALDLIAKKFAGYKGDQFAAISSAKATNEENYLIQKFCRGVMSTNNVDHCARLCHASTATGLVATLGSFAMTNSIHEIGDAACILAIGTNTTANHPIIGLEIKRAIGQGAKLIVADPREIDLCRFADLWLRHRPGTDVALLAGMMRVIIDEGLADQAFIAERCENFTAFKESLAGFDLGLVEQITSVPREQVAEAARMYATNRPASLLYAMGITQHSHGTDNVIATANLAMLTGNVGKPSTGVNPLRGQNNVQGACDMGCLPVVYPGYQRVGDPPNEEKFEAAWDCSLEAKPGLTLTEIFDAAYEGKVKALYLVGENPVLSDPDSAHIEQALGRLDFLVVQDIFLTETARLAHVVLPSTTFAEKDGTFTNTERRVQRVRQAIAPVGESRPDWWITCQIAKRMGNGGFDFSHPSQIMDEIAKLTPIYSGISYARLNNGGLQWPCLTPEHPGTPILHTKRFTRGKGMFIPMEYKPPLELPDKQYPLVLTTGRSPYHFHTGTMTRKVSGLNLLNSEELVEMNPYDAAALGIADGEMVQVTSRRGRVTARAKVTESSPPGVVFMTFHFAESATNLLTNPALDPVAKIPELKVCAVKVEKISP